MSGHSKWATIKHKKGALDAKRGQLFTKLIKEITVAAKGGGNPDTNARLRTAIQKAKEANMPQDNITKAVQKGTGELPGVSYEEITYEGYGSSGVAILVEVVTDNKNRASSEIRNIFSKTGGNMAGAGAVSWMFEKKGVFDISSKVIEEEKLMNIVLEAGAEDLTVEGDLYEVKSGPADFENVKKALETHKIACESAEITMVPKTTVPVGSDGAKQVLSLVEALEDHEDVQNVYANFDIPDDVLKTIQG
ncbi:MAG: YebC/PmpR family DNA-binding transcriptional regulator [Candidatus Omnitrophota bacterium]